MQLSSNWPPVNMISRVNVEPGAPEGRFEHQVGLNLGKGLEIQIHIYDIVNAGGEVFRFGLMDHVGFVAG